MSGLDSFFLSIPVWLTPEVNMTITRLAGVACSFADIAFIIILLKVAQALKPGAPRPKWRYRTLWFFAILTPSLFLPIDTRYFLVWQSFVLGPPYLILAYTAVKEAPTILKYLKTQIAPRLERNKLS